jgi:hypothetical protein
LRFFYEFHANGFFWKSLNTTFVALVPKKAGENVVKDFRTISLVGSEYKILVKVFTIGLKGVLGEIVSDLKNGFIQGRRILGSILTVNECWDSRLWFGRSRVLCKLDVEKAYDHVN